MEKNKILIHRSRQLRRGHTEAEMKLWYLLRNRRFMNLKFKRQYPIGNYIVDFICLEKKIIIELDGGQHSDQIEYDTRPTEYLNYIGYKVLRFWNDEIFLDSECVLEMINQNL